MFDVRGRKTLFFIFVIISNEVSVVEIKSNQQFIDYQNLLKKTTSEYFLFLEKFLEIIFEATEKVFDETRDVGKEVLAAIEELEKESELLGTDYKTCFNQHYPNMQNVYSEAKNTQADCIKGVKQEIATIKFDLSMQLDKIKKQIAVHIGDIVKCQKFSCVVDTEDIVFTKVDTLKAYVYFAIKDDIKVVAAKSGEALMCAATASDSFKTKMYNIYADVRSCLETTH